MARPVTKDIPDLKRHANGKYYIEWYDTAAKRVKKKSLRTDDAEQAKRDFADYLVGGRFKTKESPAGPYVEELLNRYMEEVIIPKGTSIERQKFAVANLVGYFGATRVSSIDIFKSREYATARTSGMFAKRGPASAATVRRELNVLVAAANHDVRFFKSQHWRLHPHQMPIIEMPKVSKKKIETFTQAQVAEMIASADGLFRAFLVLLYFTAARREAIRDLRVEQVDLENRILHLQPDGAMETAKRKATVPILEQMVPYLEFLVMVSEDGRLFPERFDVYRRFKTLCKNVGLEGHPHVFRHSRATHLLQSGVPIYKVARLLGDSTDTVERTYGHTSPEFERSAVTAGDADIV